MTTHEIPVASGGRREVNFGEISQARALCLSSASPPSLTLFVRAWGGGEAPLARVPELRFRYMSLIGRVEHEGVIRTFDHPRQVWVILLRGTIVNRTKYCWYKWSNIKVFMYAIGPINYASP